jgi:RIO kinase 1
VQIVGTEVLLEFIGDTDGVGAPRLAESRPDPAELNSLWNQLVGAMTTLASMGFAHGDLSPYNLLVHHGRLVLIDLPQVVDVISHPDGRSFLDRDARNVATWFARAGQADADPETLARRLAGEARLTLDDVHRLACDSVVLGGGRRALPDGVRSDLELLDTRRFARGVVYLRYGLQSA